MNHDTLWDVGNKPLALLSAVVHQCAVDHGWYDTERGAPELLALIHSEVSEALECYRNGEHVGRIADTGKPEGLPYELADIIIRVCDMAAYYGIDLDAAVRIKHRYNLTREYRHGGKLA